MNQLVSLLFPSFLSLILLYMSYGIIKSGIRGIKNKQLTVWTEGNSSKSYKRYTGKTAVHYSKYSIILGILIGLLGLGIVYQLLLEVFPR